MPAGKILITRSDALVLALGLYFVKEDEIRRPMDIKKIHIIKIKL